MLAVTGSVWLLAYASMLASVSVQSSRRAYFAWITVDALIINPITAVVAGIVCTQEYELCMCSRADAAAMIGGGCLSRNHHHVLVYSQVVHEAGSEGNFSDWAGTHTPLPPSPFLNMSYISWTRTLGSLGWLQTPSGSLFATLIPLSCRANR